jgi:hypothetical protein
VSLEKGISRWALLLLASLLPLGLLFPRDCEALRSDYARIFRSNLKFIHSVSPKYRLGAMSYEYVDRSGLIMLGRKGHELDASGMGYFGW